MQSYPTEHAISEYRTYAAPKCRSDDERFIESFDSAEMTLVAQKNDWVHTPPPELVNAPWLAKKDSGLSLEDVAGIKLPESV